MVHKTANTNNPIEILNILAYMPWIRELGFENLGEDIFQVFNTSTRSANFLKSFAYNVAKDGYDGNGIGTVDHAVASGLFLLQYSTYWYWLVTTCKEKKDVFPDWAAYSIDNVRFIVEACRAVAYHNITFDGQQKKFDIHEDPVLYLGIFCDEICTWERFPASNNISEVWNQHNFLESTDINLSHYPDLLGGEVQFEIINKSFDLSRIINSLDMKLKNWKKIVNIKKL